MISLILRWIASAVALYATVVLGTYLNMHLYIEPGIKAIVPSLIAVAVLAVVNALIRPIVSLLALPITCLTLGLFSFVINAVMFWLVGQVVPGFHVRGLLSAFFGSIVMSVLSGLINFLLVGTVERKGSTA
jgi:putative membrane protein